jgi:glutaredoxin
MEFKKPGKDFTVYSKSACKNCLKVKTFLSYNEKTFTIIDCDDYIIEDRNKFIIFLQEITENKFNQFPVVFYDGIYIGEYNETIQYCNEMMDFDAILKNFND